MIAILSTAGLVALLSRTLAYTATSPYQHQTRLHVPTTNSLQKLALETSDLLRTFADIQQLSPLARTVLGGHCQTIADEGTLLRLWPNGSKKQS